MYNEHGTLVSFECMNHLWNQSFLLDRLVHFSSSTSVWDDLIENVWRHLVAVGVVLSAIAVGFSR